MTHRPPSPSAAAPLSRRQMLTWATTGPWVLGGCTPPAPPLRIGAHVWPGYELLYLSQTQGWLDARQVRLIEVPSASASLRALSSQTMEGAGLTLDELLTARERGVRLTVVAVVDVSNGADVVLAQPGLRTVQTLLGKRIGVEASATGAVMLDALLTRHHMALEDVQPVPLSIDEHAQAFLTGQIDAVVTYEPVRTQLLKAGALPLFSSAEVPGLIIDVLALRPEQLATHTEAARHLVAAHFKALAAWRTRPEQCAPHMAARLRLRPQEVPAAFQDILLPDLAANHRWLAPEHGQLYASARHLAQTMLRAGLLQHPADLNGLADDRLLPPAS